MTDNKAAIEALEMCVSCLCSLRKNYAEDLGLWKDVDKAIKDGNAALHNLPLLEREYLK